MKVRNIYKLLLGCMLIGLALGADSKPPKQPFSLTRLMKTMGRDDRKFSVHNGNKILTRFYNYGGIGDWTISGRYDSGIYPQGSGRAYIAEFTPIVAASVVLENGNRVHIASDGMVSNSGMDISDDGNQWGFDPISGYANINQENIAMSDDPSTWPSSWPNKDQDWDGVWNGQYGKYARADQESYFVMDDYYNDEFNFYPDVNDSSRRGLGVEVAVRGYQWAHVAAEDIIIWTYWITNRGTSTLDSVVFGMYGDADVGDDGDQRDDDSWFDESADIVYQWDHDQWSNAKGGFKPAYFGWKFLESPGNSTDGIDNDNDGMTDESQFDGNDNDGDWNIETDDIGTDGLGPMHPGYPGPDADGTEGNGIPDLNEPNFEHTDNDESDQIGLTSFFAATWPNIEASDDEKLWSQLKPGFFDVPEQTVDITFMYGSGYFSLAPGEKKKFAVAMLFGEDQEDILRNAVTMQAIYDADYNFAKPPDKPVVTAVSGDNKVTMYWDDQAELSRDPIYGYDFEGYRIYRATDPAMLEPLLITDAYGYLTYRKPIAQFDLENGLSGLHPVSFNGVQFDVGDDSGLMHYWSDTTVENGQTYYYAVTSYDAGYYSDFYENDISPLADLQEIVPSESPVVVKQNASGEVEFLDINVVEVTPNAPAAGYVPANNQESGYTFFRHDSGHGTGSLSITVLDPRQIRDDVEYSVTFQKQNGKLGYFVEDMTEYIDTILISLYTDTIPATTGWGSVTCKNLVPETVIVSDISGMGEYTEGIDYVVDNELGIIIALNNNLTEGQNYLATYRYYNLTHSLLMNGEVTNPLFDGMLIQAYDDDLALLADSSGWLDGDCSYEPEVLVSDYGGRLYPADYEIRWQGGVGDSVGTDAVFNIDVPFEIWNMTEDDTARFVVMEENNDGQWDPGDHIVLLIGDGGMEPNYQVDFSLDTNLTVINEFEAGDVIGIFTSKPFTVDDQYSFTTSAARVDANQVKSDLDDIAVVPNPYVVTASWEPQHLFISGRGKRKIDFINLPTACTIKIFTLSGYLVDTIHHTSTIDDGAESWDLLSKDGLEVAYGVYLYHVKAPGIGEKTGKFAVIK